PGAGHCGSAITRAAIEGVGLELDLLRQDRQNHADPFLVETSSFLRRRIFDIPIGIRARRARVNFRLG
ncbi:MAG: hypothetical protein V3U22_08065, partial [Vicinamibacteria bacterium]